ncbi:lysoplasmalogenase [Spirosoma areae]
MTAKPSALFTFTFILITLLEMLGDTLSIRWLQYGCKPLIMALLAGYVWHHYQTIGSSVPVSWLLTGMLFALLGDVFLMIREVDLFAPGLGSFALMQVCYCVVFWQSIRAQGRRIGVGSFLRATLPFALYSGLFLVFLRPAFSQNPALAGLWWPVVGYVVCLSTMGVLASQRHGLPGYGWVLAGALLFILSDSFIAIDKFLRPLSGAVWLIISTYAAAQWLIIAGLGWPSKTTV